LGEKILGKFIWGIFSQSYLSQEELSCGGKIPLKGVKFWAEKFLKIFGGLNAFKGEKRPPGDIGGIYL